MAAVGFTFAIDMTGSMNTRDCPDGATRTDYAHARLPGMLAALQAHHIETLDVIAFGVTAVLMPSTRCEHVLWRLRALPSRDMMTRTDLVIAAAWFRHLQCRHARSVVVIVTDGPPALVYGVDLILNEILTRCEPGEFAIELLSVGQRSAALDLYFDALASLEPEIDLITTGALETDTLAETVNRHCNA